jgi:hypothetical protein
MDITCPTRSPPHVLHRTCTHVRARCKSIGMEEGAPSGLQNREAFLGARQTVDA